MKPTTHPITHRYQPSNTTCSQTALSMLLSSYGQSMDPLDLETLIPQCVDENGEKNGTINQQLATWCLNEGFSVKMYTFDCQIIDQSWSKLKSNVIVERMKKRKNGWVVPSMGEQWTREYTQSYIDFINRGGQLYVQQAVTSELLIKLLHEGPLLAAVSFSTLYGSGRTVLNQKQDKRDDINGRAVNHSIVIYGIGKKNTFLIADPLQKPGLIEIQPEILLGAISTAQIECDNLLFQICK